MSDNKDNSKNDTVALESTLPVEGAALKKEASNPILFQVEELDGRIQYENIHFSDVFLIAGTGSCKSTGSSTTNTTGDGGCGACS